MSTDPTDIRLSQDLKRLLASLQDESGCAWEDVLRRALTEFAASTLLDSSQGGNGNESFFDAASRLGLVGCLKSGVGDLSCNPKHMEGFGEE